MNAAGARARVRLWRRLAAACYDLLLVLAIFMVATAFTIVARRGAEIGPGEIWFQGLLFAGWWLYFVGSWVRAGQTIGMRAWRLRLVDANGDAPGWGRATLRFLAAWLSALALGLGYLWCLIDRDGRSWHGRLSGTRLTFQPTSAKS